MCILPGKFSGCEDAVSSKDKCERLVKSYGGRLVQNPMARTHFVIAPDLSLKVRTHCVL